jgi:ubiquinol-cytochrome c reductase iron-sulfur subunit
VTTTASAHATRRDFLYIATGAVGALGAAATAWPLISQMNPDASTIAAGAPIEVDLSPVADGQLIKVFWRGKPIFVRHRTAKEIKEAEDVQINTLRDPQADSARVKEGHAQWLIVYGNCTHLGCIPLG